MDTEKRNPAAYDEALAGRELDGGESLLSGLPREADAMTAAHSDVPIEAVCDRDEKAEKFVSKHGLRD